MEPNEELSLQGAGQSCGDLRKFCSVVEIIRQQKVRPLP